MVRGEFCLKRKIALGFSTIWLILGATQPGISLSESKVIPLKSGLKRKFSIIQDVFPPALEATPSLPVEAPVRLVLRLSERRVYVYQNQKVLISYPVAIGRTGWETPTGQYQVIQKISDPIWQHPFTAEVIPPGPENPLGARWIGFWTDGTNYIGFHGTPNEETVGQAISHGCVRMFNQDVLALFEKVKLGTLVIVEP